MLKNFNFGLSNSKLSPVDLEYDSTLANTFSLVFTFSNVILLHLWTTCIQKIIVSKCKSDGKWSRASKWVITKAFNFLTFSYYIRTLLEMNQYLLVSSIYEVSRFNTDGIYRIASTAYAVLVLSMCLMLVGCVGWLFASLYQPFADKHNMLGEFFEGMKQNKKSKLYALLLILRRTLFVAILVCFDSMQHTVQVVVLLILQLFYLSSIIFIRPYSKIKDNIIDILNEVYFFWCLLWLIFFYSNEKCVQKISPPS